MEGQEVLPSFAYSSLTYAHVLQLCIASWVKGPQHLVAVLYFLNCWIWYNYEAGQN